MVNIFMFWREKNSTGSRSEFGFIPKGAIGKTAGLSYKPKADYVER